MFRTMLMLLVMLSAPLGAVAQERPNLAPPGWTLAPEDPRWKGQRYVSPDGTAWLATYAVPVMGSAQQHVEAFSRGEGERITYHRRTKNFIAVSGYKGDRIFYRKSNLACGGDRWHSIALEYPARDRRKMDPIVTHIAHGMSRYDRDCRSSRG
jgi:hypothetical protein